MGEYRSVLERAGTQAPPPDLTLERVFRRRERRRRNQRIGAGVVGIALFAAAVSVAVAGDGSRSTGTPAAGGTPTVPEVARTYEQTQPVDRAVGFVGLPPERAEPSLPETGDVIAHYAEIHDAWVYVYADGRVLWYFDHGTDQAEAVYGYIRELRLTPAGVDLVRSGELRPRSLTDPWSLPAGTVKDPEVRAFVPSTFAICFWQSNRVDRDASKIASLLPNPAQNLLRGKERTYRVRLEFADPGTSGEPVGCFEVTTAEARALDEILGEAGLWEPIYGYHFEPADGWGEVGIGFQPVLPHGTWVYYPG